MDRSMRTSRSASADDQQTLPGMEATRPTDRLFFAVYPDAETAARIGDLAQRLRSEHALRGAPLRNERFHITLHHLGDYVGLPGNVVSAATEAADRMAASAFEVRFDSVSSFPGRRREHPFVLRGTSGLDALLTLHRQLGECLVVAGLGRHVDRAFTPHATLLYDQRELPLQSVDPITWKVGEFVLVDSLLGKTEHRILRRWPTC